MKDKYRETLEKSLKFADRIAFRTFEREKVLDDLYKERSSEFVAAMNARINDIHEIVAILEKRGMDSEISAVIFKNNNSIDDNLILSNTKHILIFRSNRLTVEEHFIDNVSEIFSYCPDDFADGTMKVTEEMISTAAQILEPWDAILGLIVDAVSRRIREEALEAYNRVCKESLDRKYTVENIKWKQGKDTDPHYLPEEAVVYAGDSSEIRKQLSVMFEAEAKTFLYK